jgi:hypothetical protein
MRRWGVGASSFNYWFIYFGRLGRRMKIQLFVLAGDKGQWPLALPATSSTSMGSRAGREKRSDPSIVHFI